MNPEVKVILHVREEALATAPTAEDVKALLGFETAFFVLDKRVIPTQRLRAPELANATTIADEFNAWLGATGQQLEPVPMQRLTEKLSEVEG